MATPPVPDTEPTRDNAPRPWLHAYAPGVPADIAPPDRPLSLILAGTVARHGRRPAAEFLGADISYDELNAAVQRAAGALLALGVRAGDRVALVLPNCPQHVVAFYAVLRLGAIVVEHNPLYTAEELAVQFADHGAQVAICWSATAATVAGLGVPQVLSVDLATALPRSARIKLGLPVPAARKARAALGPARPPSGTSSWEAAVARATPVPADHPHPAVSDVAVLQYTGGTTGTPKGAILTHANLAANAAQSRSWAPQLLDGEETFLAVLPMFHSYGLTLCLTTAVSLGARLVLQARFDLDQAIAAITRTRPTFFPGVPPLYQRLAEAAAAGQVDLTSIRVALSGGMALPPDLVERWESLSGGLLIEGYGMTETSPITVGNPISPGRRPGCIGVPFPSTYVRVVDESLQDVEPGEPGELLVRGPQVFAGYWNRPADTEATLLDGGWVRTGDVVTVDPSGFIRMVDRVKDLIITGGFNVYPGEVEAVLQRHPSVADAAVVGMPGPDGAEIVTAAVVLADGASAEPDELRRFCREHLAGYKTPRSFVMVDDLPRSMIGKTLHRQVRAQLGAHSRVDSAERARLSGLD